MSKQWIPFEDTQTLAHAALRVGLCPKKVLEEARRVQSMIRSAPIKPWGVLEPWDKVLPWEGENSWRQIPRSSGRDYLAFIPAAGAASRYQDGSQFAPKALMPHEGSTFLRVKHEEHSSYPSLWGQSFVAPLHWQDSFWHHLSPCASSLKTFVYTQGITAYTPRFQREGAIFHNSTLSLAPGGHGRLGPQLTMASQVAPLSGLFLRNLDNAPIEPYSQETETFLSAHRTLRTYLNLIRQNLDQPPSKALDLFFSLASSPSTPPPSTRDSHACLSWIQREVFHNDSLNVYESFEKPLILFGVIRRQTMDQGGFIYGLRDRNFLKPRCIEASHTEGESSLFFNPVFLAVEPCSFIEEQDSCWIIARKSWQKETVFYHEELLYERLSNPEKYQILWVEIPRYLFQPHKTIRSKNIDEDRHLEQER